MEIYLQTFCNTTKLDIWSEGKWNTNNKTIYYLNDCFQQLYFTIPIYLNILLITFYYFGFYHYNLKLSINILKCDHLISFIRHLSLILLLINYLIELVMINQQTILIHKFTCLLKIITILSLIFLLCNSDLMNKFEQKLKLFKLSFLLIIINSISECLTSYFIIFDTNIIIFLMNIIASTLWLIYFIFFNIEKRSDDNIVHNILINTDVDEDDVLISNDENVSFMSQIFFNWVSPLLERGSNYKIDYIHNLFKLPHRLNTKAFINIVDDYLNSLNIDSQHLASILWKRYRWTIFYLGFLKLLADSMTFLSPIYLNKLLLYLDEGDSRSRIGFFFAFILFTCTFLNAIIISLFNFKINKLSLKIRTILLSTIYEKLYRVPSFILMSRFGTGQILNLANTDIDRVVNFAPSLYQFISLPIQLVITLYLLYTEIGLVFLFGVIFILSLIPVNKFICNKIGTLSGKMMVCKDMRIKLMSEIVKGVRTIKMHFWEESFIKRIAAIRANEVKYLSYRKYLDALCVYFWATTPVIISSLVFGSYAYFNGTDSLTSNKVFTSLALLGMLIMPLNALPWVLNGLMEALVSVRRLENFYHLNEINLAKDYTLLSSINNITNDEVFHIENGCFNYEDILLENDKHQFTLSKINLIIPRNSFIAIIGKVGSGKSSFLKSILNEMNRISGEIRITDECLDNGIGYVSQTPWVLNTTIRENILFGKKYDHEFYWKVIDACALTKDLLLFVNGDQTNVGDHGALLSGGQKSRIALARAIYQNFDIYLIDEPFSSVDIYVAQEIYQKCFLQLLKNTKTVVLVTNNLDYLKDCDTILYLDNGRIKRRMSPMDLANNEFYLQLYNNENSLEKMNDNNNGEDNIDLNGNIEERKQGVVKMNVYISYISAIGYFLFTIIIIFICLMQFSKSFSDFWLSFWVMNKSNGSNIAYYFYVFIAIGVINSFITLVRAFTFAYGGIRAAINIHDKLLSSVLRTALQFFESTPFGVIINRFSSDIFNVDDALPFTLNIFLAQLSGLIASLIVSTYGLPWVAIILVPLLLPYYFIQKYYRETSRELKRLSSVSLSPIYTLIDDTIQGLITIRAYCQKNRFVSTFAEKVNDYNRIQYAMAAVQQWLNLRLQLMGVLVTSAVAFLAVYMHYYHVGEVNSNLVGLSLVYSLSLTALLNGAVQAFTQTELDIISVERIKHLLTIIKTKFDFLEESKEVELTSSKLSFQWPRHGVISFQGVSLRYQADANLALDRVTFETVPGEHVAIVGRTGSGKSSLFQVLFRLVNIESGLIYIDGVDISKLSFETLRSNIFIIPQDAFLFSGTIRDNLDPLNQYRDDEIWTALYSCSINILVDSFGGLDAKLQESGKDLSIGQRHLFCLARAVLNKKRIVCMDEVTANIDVETEAVFKELLKTVFKTSTVLYITHRIESLESFHRVIVMDLGRIVKFCSLNDYLNSLGE